MGMKVNAESYKGRPVTLVATGDVSIFAQNTNRTSMSIRNTGNVSAWIYPQDTNRADATELPVGTGVDIAPPPSNQFFGYTTSSTTTIEIMES